jgi:hypothetical protein
VKRCVPLGSGLSGLGRSLRKGNLNAPYFFPLVSHRFEFFPNFLYNVFNKRPTGPTSPVRRFSDIMKALSSQNNWSLAKIDSALKYAIPTTDFTDFTDFS